MQKSEKRALLVDGTANAKAPRMKDSEKSSVSGAVWAGESSRSVQRAKRKEQILWGLGTIGWILSFTLRCEDVDDLGLRCGMIASALQGESKGPKGSYCLARGDFLYTFTLLYRSYFLTI